MLERTVGGRAVLEVGRDLLIFPWEELMALRELVTVVPPEAAWDEDHPRIERGSWAASGSSFGIALMREARTVYLSREEWETLQKLLYTDDTLLSQKEAAGLAGRPQQRVAEAVAAGKLFAFTRPGYRRRRWLIPRSAVEKWKEQLRQHR